MTGVAVYLAIGFVLFVPLGFLIGFLQHKNQEAKENENNKHPVPGSEERAEQ